MNFFDRHAPHCVGDLVFENATNASIIAQYAAGQQTRHLLLYGPAGSGKSEAAKIIINSCVPAGVNSPFTQPIHPMSYEHDDFSSLLNDWNWQMSSCGSPRGYSVIDEVDQFKKPMLLKLRAFMDQYGSVGTIITTTNYLSELDTPMQDRFKKLNILRPTLENWLVRADAIFRAEGVNLPPNLLQTVFAGFTGSARDLIEQIESCVTEFRTWPDLYPGLCSATAQPVVPPVAPPADPPKLAIIINKRP